MKSRLNPTYLLFAAMLLIHLLFFLSGQLRSPNALTDSEEYLLVSQNLYSEGILYSKDLSDPIVEEHYTRRPPLYPVFLGIDQLTRSPVPVFVVQILLSLFSIWLVYRIFMNLNTSPDNNPISKRNLPLILALLFLLATPAQFIYSNLVMAEILFQAVLVLMVWCVYKYFLLGKESRYIWLFSLFLTLGMATKPVLFPFAIVVLILSLWLFLKTRRWSFILALILPVVWITVYSIRNHQQTGSVQYSSIQTANMINYNLRYFLMVQEGSDSAAVHVDRLYEICGNESSYREKNKCLSQEARKIILEKPLRYALFHLKGSVRFFLDPGRYDLVTFFNLNESGSPGFLQALNNDGLSGVFRQLKQQGWGLIIILLVIALFKLFKVVGFVLYLFKRDEQLPLRIFLVILVGYLALVTGPLGASRFFLPVELLIIGGAIRGWVPVLVRKGSRK